MPNHGRSGACQTCKRRRVKCDEARPTCSQCQRLDICCGGYDQKFHFKDQTHKFKPKATTRKQKIAPKQPDQLETVLEEPSRSLVTAADVAVPFFLVHCAGLGRSLVAARGFFETLIPAYNAQSQGSALSLAVSAVAARVFSRWQLDDKLPMHIRPHSIFYVKAVSAVRSAIEHSEERHRPATALAILSLHFYENISAICDLRQAKPVHHHGMLALLPFAVSDRLDGQISTYVQNFVLHLEVASALRQKRPLQPTLKPYLPVVTFSGSTETRQNISLALDLIGVEVAELQAEYMRASAEHGLTTLDTNSRHWVFEAVRIDTMLIRWTDSVPQHWRPLRLEAGKDFSTDIPAYQSACDVYPSCQLSSIWNLWRIQRLLLSKIRVGSAPPGPPSSEDYLKYDLLRPEITTQQYVYNDTVRELVDGICYSVPFFIGNRTKPSSLTDFTDKEILFPSLHSIFTERASISARRQDGDGTAMTEDEHRRHIIVNGAWHAMSPLTSLLTLFADDRGGREIADCLRTGQQDWIREQVLRIGTLLCLPTPAIREPVARIEPSPLPTVDLDTDGTAADLLAKQVRKGATYMSGT